VIKNWTSDKTAEVQIDNKAAAPGPACRQGIVRDTDGTRTLVIWLKQEATKNIDLAISAGA